MFNPNVYDSDDSKNQKNIVSPKNNGVGKFIDDRETVIKDLNAMKPLIKKECEYMDRYLEEHPDGKATGPFNEKLKGWSKILNGIDIVNKMYASK